MPIPQRILNFLKENKIKYETIKHRTVYTAFDKAATLKVKPHIIVKTLILKVDGGLAMALIPGGKNLDKNKFKKVVNKFRKKQNLKLIKTIDFIPEKLMKNKFKGVKIGAIPPFGNFWRIPTFLDNTLLKEPKIIVNGGDYEWSIKIKTNDFKKLIPGLVIGSFSKTKK